MVAGDLVNLADFAYLRWWEGAAPDSIRAHAVTADASGMLRPAQAGDGTWHLGLEWDEPRDVERIVVTYVDEVPPDLQVEYWQANWPTPAPERRTGARRGWIGRDDPWHGRWITVRAECVVDGETCTFVFDPVDGPELRPWVSWQALEEAEDYLASFRRTLKVRLVSGGVRQPVVRHIEATSGSRWREGKIRAVFDSHSNATPDRTLTIRAANGRILAAQEVHADEARFEVLYAGSDALEADRTILTIGGPIPTFSFLVGDLDRGPIYLPDHGVAITRAEATLSLDDLRQQLADAPRPIYDRVFDEPEHSLARAMAEIPPLDVEKQDSYMGLGRYLPLGIDGGRQEFALRHNGELFVAKSQLKLSGRDAARLLWAGQQMRFRFGTGDPPDFRETGHHTEQTLLEGWLPVVISRWTDRELAFEETTFATLLAKPLRALANDVETRTPSQWCGL